VQDTGRGCFLGFITPSPKSYGFLRFIDPCMFDLAESFLLLCRWLCMSTLCVTVYGSLYKTVVLFEDSEDGA
jgi:hypothetical protein